VIARAKKKKKLRKIEVAGNYVHAAMLDPRLVQVLTKELALLVQLYIALHAGQYDFDPKTERIGQIETDQETMTYTLTIEAQ